MPMRTQLATAAILLAATSGAWAQADARNVPLMPNCPPTDIDTLTRPNTDTRPYAYQPPTVYGRPNAAPPYYERRYYGDRPATLAPMPQDRSRDLTPFETRSLYGAPSSPRWDIPARPVPPATRPAPAARPVPQTNAKLPEAAAKTPESEAKPPVAAPAGVTP